ncbi:MAG: hypothetical protein KDB63_19705 [Nocardioidaceae bacterium]|nr:hypothetical protein [Nocardioidaceae bacterium]
MSLIGWDWSGAERTELAQWLMAATSAVTLVAAIVAAFYAAGAFRLESAREERWNDAQRRAQAALVAAWPTGDVGMARAAELNEETGRYPLAEWVTSATITLRNASEVPVTRVKAQVVIEVRGDGVSDEYQLGRHELAVLPPGDAGVTVQVTTTRNTAERLRFAGQHSDEQEVRFEPQVFLTFVDSAGVTWSRWPSGALTEMTMAGVLARDS